MEDICHFRYSSALYFIYTHFHPYEKTYRHAYIVWEIADYVNTIE